MNFFMIRFAFKRTHLGANSLSGMLKESSRTHFIERCTFSLAKVFEALQ